MCLKVNYAPYLTIIDFFDDVVYDQATAVFNSGTLVVKVPKRIAGEWPALSAEGSKSELKSRRDAAAAKKLEEQVKVGACLLRGS